MAKSWEGVYARKSMGLFLCSLFFVLLDGLIRREGKRMCIFVNSFGNGGAHPLPFCPIFPLHNNFIV